MSLWWCGLISVVVVVWPDKCRGSATNYKYSGFFVPFRNGCPILPANETFMKIITIYVQTKINKSDSMLVRVSFSHRKVF